MDIITPLKRCSKCKQELPATTEFFYQDKRRNQGLQARCIPCTKAARKGYNVKPRKHRPRKYKFRPYRDRNHNYEKQREHNKKWRASERGQEYHRNYNKNYNTTKPRCVYASSKAGQARHRARKRSLPDSFTGADVSYAVDYFHSCCAVCGRQLKDLFGTHTMAMDHWIPLSCPECPGTIPTNMIPLCHGIDGCNNSKGNKQPQEWLVEKFGKKKAETVLSRITAFFLTVRKV